MYRWPFWKKRSAQTAVLEQAAQGAAGGGDEDWTFLRERPDFDVDEMMSVHAPAGTVVRAAPLRATVAEWCDYETPTDGNALLLADEIELSAEDLRLANLAQQAFTDASRPVKYEPGVALAALDDPNSSADLLEALLERSEAIGVVVPQEKARASFFPRHA